VRDFQPREIWWGVAVPNHQPTSAVTEEAVRARATWRWLQRGDRFELGGVEIRVHHPPLPDWERQKVRNNDSLVLELRYGTVSVLLTGDIDRDVERELLPTLDLLPTVVLKVAHHGSGTSSAEEFIQHVRPSVALIGVGRANPYGHPVPYVLERLHAIGSEVFRTDLDGQVTVSTDGNTVWATTFTGRSWRLKDSHEGHDGTKRRGR
jgi:competence protein ComEC